MASARFALTGVHEFINHPGWETVSGWLGVALAAVALYAALAFEVEDTAWRTVLPVWPHRQLADTSDKCSSDKCAPNCPPMLLSCFRTSSTGAQDIEGKYGVSRGLRAGCLHSRRRNALYVLLAYANAERHRLLCTTPSSRLPKHRFAPPSAD